MKSPFPGMDPYLELWWRDVHNRLCVYAADQLRGQLGSDLRARLDERLIVESEHPTRNIYPDIRIVEHPSPRQPRRFAPNTGVALAEPLLVRVGSEPEPQPFIEIIDIRSGNRVVTIIELVSPTNKRLGAGKAAYVQKQQECVDGRVNLVEIDLVRAGERVTLAERHLSPESRSTYQVSVYRATSAVVYEVYPIQLREQLPAFRVPLRDKDEDAVLNLQALIEMVYENGEYADDIDYRRPCEPPLAPDDLAWLETLLPPR
jgi:hypothetical protein